MQATSRDWLNLIITATPVPDFAAQVVEVSLSPDQFNPTTDWFSAEHTAEGLRLMIGPGTQLEGGPGSLAPGSWHAWGRIVDMGDGTLPVFYIGAFLIEGGTDLAPMPPVTIGQAALDAALGSLASPVVTIVYNELQQPVTVTENGVATTYTYNPDGSVGTDTRAGVTRLYTYDGNGNVTGIEIV